MHAVVLFLVGAMFQFSRANEQDPFADLAPAAKPVESVRTWKETLFKENLGFRKEILSRFDIDQDGRGASSQSAGFEVLKKFSTATATVASLDFQGRLVRRDGEGGSGW